MTAARRDPLPNFRALCESACIKLWGEPTSRNRKELRWNGCDAYSAKTFSFKKQAWCDHGAGWGGSTLDLVAYSKGQPKQEQLRGKAFIDAWRDAHAMGLVPVPPPEKPPNGGGGPILATYPYHDESGAILFEVVRFDTADPKHRFSQRRPDGKGGVIWDIKGVRRVLYRLPELIAAVKAGQRVYICEGERDSKTAVAFGCVATTMPGGVGKWRTEYDKFFRGGDVVVVSDNDPQAKDPNTGKPQFHPNGKPVLPGQDHAANVVRRMLKVAAHVRTIIFPQKDLTLWRDAGGTRAALDALTEAAPDLIALPDPDDPDTEGAGLQDEVALRFAERHADYRYVAVNSQWMRWNATRWLPENTLRAYDDARALCRDAGKATASMVAGVERHARADRRIAADVDIWDANPDILCTPGGVVDLKTGELRPARRDDYCTKQASVTPAPPDTPCDLWGAFLDRVFNRNDDLIAFIWRFLGYCLTGDISEHVFAFLFGTGRNGKGVFCRTAINILGDGYANTSPIEMFLESKHDRHPTEFARLNKIRLTVAQETPKGRAWDEAKIKNMTGGDPIPARFMHQNFFDVIPSHKLIIAGNHKPKLKVVDEAIRARLLLIPFTVTIPEAERDPELTEKLRAEYPAILRRTIDGCLDWRANGLGVPPAVRDASDDYFHEQDMIAHWLDECCERKQLAFTASSELFASWKAWATEHGVEVLTEKAFAKALQDRGWTYKRTNKARGFNDLVLKPGQKATDPAEDEANPAEAEIDFGDAS
jgi:putative DNA primase/helicase